MPNWKKVIVSGSSAHLNHVTASGHISGSSTSTGSFGAGYIDNKLGIGTTSPSSWAGVATVLEVSDPSSAGIVLHDTGGVEFSIYSADSKLYLGTNSTLETHVMTMLAAGNVGIGETSPLGKLHVKTGETDASAHSGADELVLEGTSDMGISFLSATSGTGVLNFGDSNDNDIGSIEYGHTNDSFKFTTNATAAMWIASTSQVGIGIASPDAHLHISSSSTMGSATASLHIEGSGSSVVAVDGTLGRLFSVTDEMSGSIFSANTIAGLPVIEAFSDYKVTLGPFSSPMEIDSSGNISASADIVAEGDVIAYYTSDIRLKDNLQVIKGSLDKIGKINGYEFDWNEKSPGWARERGHDVGVIAQEVQKVLPEVVVERKSGYLGVDYKRLIPLLVESIKELKQEVENLKKKVN